MDLKLYVKEGGELKVLRVPKYVVKDLLRDRLSKSELERINRLAESTKTPETIPPGSVFVDFSTKTAQCFQAGLRLADLEPTWKVNDELITLTNC